MSAEELCQATYREPYVNSNCSVINIVKQNPTQSREGGTAVALCEGALIAQVAFDNLQGYRCRRGFAFPFLNRTTVPPEFAGEAGLSIVLRTRPPGGPYSAPTDFRLTKLSVSHELARSAPRRR